MQYSIVCVVYFLDYSLLSLAHTVTNYLFAIFLSIGMAYTFLKTNRSNPGYIAKPPLPKEEYKVDIHVHVGGKLELSPAVISVDVTCTFHILICLFLSVSFFVYILYVL